MKTYKKVIHGYTVDVETEIEDDPSTQGWVEKGSYSASLCLAGQSGELTDSRDMTHHIPSHTLDAIEKWADSVGY